MVVGIKEKIIKFVRDVLESRGVVQEMRVVEFDLDEVLEYLEKSGVGNWGDFWLWMEDLRRVGRILWYLFIWIMLLCSLIDNFVEL
ncbi:MAG: hypothetical protein LZ174_09260, partial [Thaumarchaeota archaeon]|nr:hypothetical protein [Candidatus Geocrenenecus arthurdayi]